MNAEQPAVTYRPKASLRMGVSLSSSLVLASVLGWVMTPARVRDLFTPIQVGTLMFFLAIMVALALGIGLSYVHADEQGLRFRNGVKTHQVPWSEIKAIRYREGDPWPFVLVRSAVEQHPLLGIQRSDRDYAERCVDDLRHRLARAYGTEHASGTDDASGTDEASQA